MSIIFIISKFFSLIFIEKTTKTLLLDLDETLITSCSKRDGPDKILIPEGDRSHSVREYYLYHNTLS